VAVIIFSNLVTVVMKETVSSAKLYSENWNKASTVLDHTIEGMLKMLIIKYFVILKIRLKIELQKLKTA